LKISTKQTNGNNTAISSGFHGLFKLLKSIQQKQAKKTSKLEDLPLFYGFSHGCWLLKWFFVLMRFCGPAEI